MEPPSPQSPAHTASIPGTPSAAFEAMSMTSPIMPAIVIQSTSTGASSADAWDPPNTQELIEAFLAGRSKPSAPISVQHACSAISDRDFSLICRYVAKNGPVGRLVLSGCGIDDQRAEILAQCLERNSFLQELDISFNSLTNQGANAIMRASLSHASSISEIVSVGNKIDEEIERQLWDVAILRLRKRKDAHSQPLVIRLASNDESRTPTEIYNSTRALLKREAEVKKAYHHAQEELREAELSLAIIRKNLARLSTLPDQKSPREKKPPLEPNEVAAKQNVQGHHMRINLRDIQMGEIIDKGGSGALITYAYVDGWQCVCKEMPYREDPDTALEYFEKEITLLENLPHHKNIVRYLFHDIFQGNIRLFMTRYRSSLLYILYERDQAGLYFKPDQVRRYCIEIIKGLEFLHRHSIIHRDLKADNIFVSLDEHGEISKMAIGDFDCAKLLTRNTNARTVLGTAGFMAPEVWRNSFTQPNAYTYKADVFSFGMVMYEIMALKIPYHDLNESQISECVRVGLPPTLPPQIGSDLAFAPLVSLHRRCTSLDPYARPDPSEIKQILIDMRFQ